MRAIADGLFTDDIAPQLIGGRCVRTGRIVFPCPRGNGFVPYPLQRRGHLWSWTVQRYRPKSPPYGGPESFVPWALVYVELPGETIVEARLTGIDVADVAIGMDMELTRIPLDPDAADPVLIPAFRPVEKAQ